MYALQPAGRSNASCMGAFLEEYLVEITNFYYLKRRDGQASLGLKKITAFLNAFDKY